MPRNNGDLPLMKEKNGNRLHITISGAECLCGYKWRYGTIDRAGKAQNILFRKIEDVTCKKCKELYEQNNN